MLRGSGIVLQFFYHCLNKLSQTQWLKTTQMHYLTVIQISSLSWLNWFLQSRLHKAKIKVLANWVVIRRLWGEYAPQFIQVVGRFLLVALAQGSSHLRLPSSARGLSTVLVHKPCISEPAMTCPIFLKLENSTSFSVESPTSSQRNFSAFKGLCDQTVPMGIIQDNPLLFKCVPLITTAKSPFLVI